MIRGWWEYIFGGCNELAFHCLTKACVWIVCLLIMVIMWHTGVFQSDLWFAIFPLTPCYSFVRWLLLGRPSTHVDGIEMPHYWWDSIGFPLYHYSPPEQIAHRFVFSEHVRGNYTLKARYKLAAAGVAVLFTVGMWKLFNIF